MVVVGYPIYSPTSVSIGLEISKRLEDTAGGRTWLHNHICWLKSGSTTREHLPGEVSSSFSTNLQRKAWRVEVGKSAHAVH